MVSAVGVPAPFTWFWVNQNHENREAAECYDDDEESEKTGFFDDDSRRADQTVQTIIHQTRQPDAPRHRRPGPGPAVSETSIGDGIHHGHVALHAREDVKIRLSWRGEGENGVRRRHQSLNAHQSAATQTATSHETQQLQDHHVVGEDVQVAGRSRPLCPTSLDAQAEGVDEEWN